MQELGRQVAKRRRCARCRVRAQSLRGAQSCERERLKLAREEVGLLRCPQLRVTAQPPRKPSQAPHTIHRLARAGRLKPQVSHEPVNIPVHENMCASVQQHSVGNNSVCTRPVPVRRDRPGVRPRVVVHFEHRPRCPCDVVTRGVLDDAGNAVANAESLHPVRLLPRLAEQRER
eukprot:2731268-Prymnesium_polylepis.2